MKDDLSMDAWIFFDAGMMCSPAWMLLWVKHNFLGGVVNIIVIVNGCRFTVHRKSS